LPGVSRRLTRQTADLRSAHLRGLRKCAPASAPGAYGKLAFGLLFREGMTTAWALQPAETFRIDVPERLGPFDVVGSIAEGGMGIVLRGQDRLTGRQVALKTVRGPRRSDAASIRREIVALGHLSHPGIIRLVADGTWDDNPWMALELLDGRTVCDEIDLLWRKGPEGLFQAQQGRCRSDDLPTMPSQIRTARRTGPYTMRSRTRLAAAGRLHDVTGIAKSLCAALDYIHGLGLVHRDVKPSNVFLGEDGRVTLLDFGLVCPAHGIPGSYATADSCVGTMEYAAPEQIRGESVDARADIYSLGCVVYELVTGQRPVGGARPHVAGMPATLEDLLHAMVADRPEDRPATAGAVAARLAEVPTTGPDVQPASENPTMTAQTARIDAATITIA
jgi:serine/threonine protein kinase